MPLFAEKRREPAKTVCTGAASVRSTDEVKKENEENERGDNEGDEDKANEEELVEVQVARVAVEPLAILSDGEGREWRTLFDTGASIDCAFRANLVAKGAAIRAGRRVTLIMADKSRRQVNEWADLRLSLGTREFEASFVVIPEENSEMDLILGLPTQTSFGNVTYGKEGLRLADEEIRWVKSVTDANAPSTRIDEDGFVEVRVGSEQDESEIAYRHELLAKAKVGKGFRILVGMLEKMAGLVGRTVVTAQPRHASLRERRPKARIKMAEGHDMPRHVLKPVALHMMPVWRKTVDELVKGGLLEKSEAPGATRGMLIPKTGRPHEFRFVSDYRDLNEGVVRDCYGLPALETCLTQAFSAGARFLGKIDLASFFHQIPLEPESSALTSITTPVGLYQWKCVPQGLKTSPAIAQRMIDFVLSAEGDPRGEDDLKSFCTAYIDDVGFAGSTEEEFWERCEQILTRLHDHGFQIRLDKCQFCVTRMTFLGYELDAESDDDVLLIRPDPAKLRAMLDYETPKSKTALKRFIGMVQFLSKLVQGLAEVSAPLHAIANVDEWDESTWTREHEQAFKEIKSKLAKEPFVSLPSGPEAQFVARTDASKRAIGGGLFQRMENGREVVVVYLNAKFSGAQENWATWEKELYALVYIIQRYGYLFLGSPKPLIFVSDHKPLGELTGYKMTEKIARWMAILSTVEWTFEYEKGENNVFADAMSRQNADGDVNAWTIGEGVTEATRALCGVDHAEEWHIDIREAREKHDDIELNLEGSGNDVRAPSRELLSKIRASLLDDPEERLLKCQKGEGDPHFSWDEETGFVFRESPSSRTDAPDVMYIPRTASHVWEEITKEYHQSIIHSNHASAEKTYEKIARRFWWEGMRQDVIKYVKNCVHCQRDKRPVTRRRYLPQARPPPTRVFEVAALDHKTGLPKDKRGYDAILVIVDFLSRMGILIPTTKGGSTSAETIRLLQAHLFAKWGVPRKLVSDRGSAFASRVATAAANLLGYDVEMSTAHNPKTAAIAERMIRTATEHLRVSVHAYANLHPDNWSEALPAIEFAYNDSVNPRTFPYTPFFIAHGRETWTPIKSTVKQYFGETAKEGARDGTPQLRSYVERMRQAEEVTRENHRRLTSKFLREQREKFSYTMPFTVGTWVWLTDVRLKGEIKPPVLESRRIGPLIVTEALPHDSYKLATLEETPAEDKRRLGTRLTRAIKGERLITFHSDLLDNTDWENDEIVGDAIDFEDTQRNVIRTLSASTVKTPLGERPLCILDLGAGSQSLGKECIHLFGDRKKVKYLSMDIDEKTSPEFAWSLFDFMERKNGSAETREQFRPGMIDIIWFSGNCHPFSQANTTGKRDLDEGMRLIRAGFDIIRYLKPRVIHMESANSGPNRLALQPEMERLANEFGLKAHPCTQCHYGFLYKKPTVIYSNIELRLRICTAETPCEVIRLYSRHLRTSQSGPSGIDRDILGVPREWSGRVAPGLVQLCLFSSILHMRGGL